MDKLKKFFASLKPIWVMRVVSIILTLLSLLTIVQDESNGFLAWLLGLLNGAILLLIWLEDDDDD